MKGNRCRWNPSMFEKVFAYSKKHAVELWKKKSVFYYPERSTCLFVVWPAIEHEQGTYSGHSVLKLSQI